MQWGPELRGIDHATAPSISVLSRAIPDRQSVYGARNKSCTRLHDSAWQCMMDGVVHSWHFIAGKLVTITQAPGNSFNMQQTSISIENIIYLSCLHVQHLSFLFSLSLHSDWHRGPNTQTNSITRLHSQILCSMHTLSTQIHSFLYSMHQSINNEYEHIGKQFSAGCSKTNVNFIYFWSYMKDSVQWA